MFKELPVQGPKPMARGQRAMVSSSHPAVTEVMLKVLRDGGNAVDAAVAGSLVQPVYEPHQTNHAGTVVALIWDAETGRAHFVDASAELPEGVPLFRPNPHSPASAACIPGFVPGLASMAERFGSKPWSYLAASAVKAAEEGPVINSWMYGYLHRTLPSITYFPSGREFFTPDGFLVPAGERWRVPKLAETLRRLADEGPEYFTKGGWARRMVEEGNRIGWGVTMKHMASYKPMWRDPLSFTYRDREIVGIPPPQRGALYMGLIYGILEEFDLRSMGHYTESAETLALMAWAMSRAHQEKGLMHDPQFYDVPVDVLLSKDYHRLIAGLWRGSRPKIDLTDFLRLTIGEAAMNASLPSSEKQVHESCELSIVDEQGNWVQMMNTGNGGGVPGMVVDGVKCGGTTVLAQEVTGTGRFGWVVEPGARTRHAIANTFVLDDGRPWLAIGSPGDCIFTVPQALLNVLEFEMDPYPAVDAPRFWPLGDDGTLEIESRIPGSVVADLARMGILVRPLGKYNWRMGSMQLVWRDRETGELGGVADPRRLGKANGF
jgi:gamma-glutamyltranspeptidase/glutathione hydrolase